MGYNIEVVRVLGVRRVALFSVVKWLVRMISFRCFDYENMFFLRDLFI